MSEHEISPDKMFLSSVINDDEYSTKLKQYKMEIITYKQQIEECEKIIIELRKTIHSLEKQLYRKQDNYSQFIQELFYLCLQHPIKSSPSHDDMKIYIQQKFNRLAKQSSKELNMNNSNHYQECLDIIEEYQNLFNIKCFKQIPISLTDLYNKYGELKNFIHSISSIIDVENKDQELVIKTLEKIVEDSKTDEMNKFKKLTKVKNMNEAMRKICFYDEFIPYYNQLIKQIMNLLEISAEDQIIPAIQNLKLRVNIDIQ